MFVAGFNEPFQIKVKLALKDKLTNQLIESMSNLSNLTSHGKSLKADISYLALSFIPKINS